ncbi:hypothetical protein BYT27DRAFT_7201668, partial [Phlegmacium glaucopus]
MLKSPQDTTEIIASLSPIIGISFSTFVQISITELLLYQVTRANRCPVSITRGVDNWHGKSLCHLISPGNSFQFALVTRENAFRSQPVEYTESTFRD